MIAQCHDRSFRFDEMVDMANDEFQSHINELNRMKVQGEDSWGPWPPWKVAHAIKGLCLSLSFSRVATYAKDVESLNDKIKAEDIEAIVAVFSDLFAESIKEAKKGEK